VKRGRRGAGLATACHRQQPGGGAEPVSLGSPGRDLPVGGPCGPVERVGGPAQRRITDRPGGGVECGGRRPGRIGGRGWVSPGAAPDLRRRRLSLPRRVPVNASRSGAVNRNGPGRDPGAAGWRFHWRRNWAASGRTPGALPRTTGARRPGRRAGERDRVAGDLTRGGLAIAQPDQDASLAELRGKPGLVPRLPGRDGDPGPEQGPGHHPVNRRAEGLGRPTGPAA
jgi:hypothetical protein